MVSMVSSQQGFEKNLLENSELPPRYSMVQQFMYGPLQRYSITKFENWCVVNWNIILAFDVNPWCMEPQKSWGFQGEWRPFSFGFLSAVWRLSVVVCLIKYQILLISIQCCGSGSARFRTFWSRSDQIGRIGIWP